MGRMPDVGSGNSSRESTTCAGFHVFILISTVLSVSETTAGKFPNP